MRRTLPQRPPVFSSPYKLPGQVYLWLAILIFGASNAVTRKLTDIGNHNFVNGQNPISLCNVLFVGNLCALIVLILLYRQQWSRTNLDRLSRRQWVGLLMVAILSGALAPGLIFQALAISNVNNVVLIGRLEPPLTLALSVWILKERINIWETMGAIVAFLGVALTIVFSTDQTTSMRMGSLSIGLGELLAAGGAIALAIATIIGKKRLSQVPLGIYSIVRTALGTLIFFMVALVLYGSDHFMNAFSPFLWKWMLVYGAVIVVVGQSFWIVGLRASSVSTASIIGSFTPIAGILAAYLILGETPTTAQYMGGSLLLVGIVLSQIGLHRQTTAKSAPMQLPSVQAEQTIESGMGFKGI